MTDRELMQQALDYMESIGQMDMYPEQWQVAVALRERLAQPEQEPVAWFDKALNTVRWKDGLLNCDLADQQPIYVAPQPAQQPLTYEEIVDVIAPLYQNRVVAEMAVEVSMDEYRAIEAAHGIKGD